MEPARPRAAVPDGPPLRRDRAAQCGTLARLASPPTLFVAAAAGLRPGSSARAARSSLRRGLRSSSRGWVPASSRTRGGSHAVVLPLALLFFLALGLAREGVAWLPAVAFVATYLVQTHVGTSPVTACVVLAALALAGRAGRRLLAPRPLALTILLLAALWALPVVEEAHGTPAHPGNLTLLWRFFRDHGASHTFVEVFGPLARELGGIPMALASAIVPSTSDQRYVGAGVFALLLVALLPLGLAAARRRRDDETATLAWLALVATAAALFSGLRIVDVVLDYLLLFAAAVSFAGWTALALVATRPIEERGRGRAVGAACAVVAVLCLVSNARGLAQQQPVPIETKESVRTFGSALGRISAPEASGGRS